MINERNAQRYCKDDICRVENYDKAISDTAHTWDLHHRLELTIDGELAHSRDELKRLGMYYNRPYFELIFLTKDEHRRLHNKGKNNPLYGKSLSEETKQKLSESLNGKHRSEETRKKISESKKGEKNYFYGKRHSEATRKKMSESHKGKSFTDEHRQKMASAQKGENNAMYGKHHSEETLKKMSESHKAYWERRRSINSLLENHSNYDH